MLASCEKELPHRVVTPIDAPAETYLSIEGVGETFGIMAPKTKSFPISVKADTKADQLLTFTVAPNPDKVAAYNAANGTDYEMVPGDAYELSTKEFMLPRYNTVSSTGTLTIKANGLPDDGKTRVLPISITKVEGDAETKMDASDSTVFITVYRVSLADIKFEKGKGTEAEPYLVEYANDMLAMINDLKAGEPTYIKLAADIDMSSIEEWMPVNISEPYKTIHFDGDNHTIKGLSSNAALKCSLFGVLKGSIKNVTFEDCTLQPGSDATGTGLIAGLAQDAEFKNVTVKNLTINSLGGNKNGMYLGGAVGIAEGCTFDNVKVDVDVVDADQNGTIPRVVGGMAGILQGANSTVKNCEVTGTVRAHHYGGGLIGVVKCENQEITNCVTDVHVIGLVDDGNYNAGFIGYANKGLVVTDCGAKGNVDLKCKNYGGGFIAGIQGNTTIKRCFSEGDVTNTIGTHVGAFIGNMGVKNGDWNDNTNAGNSVIEDCYCSGSLTVTAGNGSQGRMNSGFIAIAENLTNVSVSRCYASGDVITTGANGPCAGLFAMAKSSKLTDNIDFSMSQCIAWNKKIVTKNENATTWSSGAIIGVSNVGNTLTDNYRRADMEYVEVCNGIEFTLCDHENTSPSSPLPSPATNKNAYHGKAAPAGATCSQVAKSLNWPEDVWDLSGDMPKLK